MTGLAVNTSRRTGWWRGIRLRLLLLVVLAVAPVITLRLWELKLEASDHLVRAKEQALELARRGAERQQEVILEARTILEVVSRVDKVLSGTPDECRAFLSGLSTNRPWAKGFWLLEPNGTVTCTTVPGGVGLNIVDRPYFRDLLRSRTFVVSDFVVGRVRVVPTMVAALPVLDEGGRITKVIAASLNLEWLSRFAADVGQRTGGTALLIDGDGIVLARYPDREGWTGRNFSDHPLVREVRAQRESWAEVESLDSMSTVIGFAPLPSTRASLVISFPKEQILGTVTRRLHNACIELAWIGILALMGVWLAGEAFFLRPIRELAAFAERIGRGDFRARLAHRRRAAEFDILASTVNDMAARLDKRDADLIAAQERLALLAVTDGLTDLSNRRCFDQRLEAEWSKAEETQRPLGLLLLDIDHFKEFNDRYGHLAGDGALRAVAETLREGALPPAGVSARFGGEEFAVLLPGISGDQACALAEGLRQAVLRAAIAHEASPERCLTVSIGAAACTPAPGGSPIALIEAADAALYLAKASGRNRVVCSSRLVEAGNPIWEPRQTVPPVGDRAA
jgi:diguanylate cyclase (GGDEF)-like protein